MSEPHKLNEQEAMAIVTDIIELLQSKKLTVRGAQYILSIAQLATVLPLTRMENTIVIAMPENMQWKGNLPPILPDSSE